MAKGMIKRIVGTRGFGFIQAEDGQEFFFHRSAVRGVEFATLREGQHVEFDVERGPKGLKAVNVRLARGPGT